MKKIQNVLLVGLILVLALSACQKRKNIKTIEGTWKVTEMTLDDKNVLNKIIDSLSYPNCDSIMHIEQGYYDIKITFNKNGTYERVSDFHIASVDTAYFRQNCELKAVLKTITETESGKWELFGKSTLQMITANNSEGNKIINITEKLMIWETDVVVSSGIVMFNGIKKTKLEKL
jgi:hypothetical protein